MKNYFVNERYNVKQSDETEKLLKKPITVSDKEKLWPINGIRGINSQPVAAFNANPINPGLYYSEECFKRLKSFGINSIRVMIKSDEGTIWSAIPKDGSLPDIPEDDPIAPYRNHINALKVSLELAEKYDMWIIPSGDNIVGRKIDYFYKKDDGKEGYFNSLMHLWSYIAKNFGKHPRLLAYDLLNEPWTDSEKEFFHNVCAPRLIEEIRKYDKNTYIVIESAPYALPIGFNSLPVYDDKKIIYSVHWYFPHMYTHQGVGSYPKFIEYPGMIKCFPDSKEEYWDIETLREYLKPVRDFQLKNNAIIWVGEFSAIRWAPGAEKWLSDSIKIFEEYGWSWATHSYRGWNGWNHTFSADDEPSNIDDGGKNTEALKALIKGFSYNER